MTFRRPYRRDLAVSPLWLFPAGFSILVLATVLRLAGGLAPGLAADGTDLADSSPSRDDLEPIIVQIGTDERAPIRVGDHRFATAEDLGALLRKLVTPGGKVYVRFADDVPFSQLDEMVRACRHAGFGHVVLLTAGDGAPPAPADGVDRPRPAGDTPAGPGP